MSSTVILFVSMLSVYGQGFITFDDVPGAILFSDTQPLTTQLEASGITWSGGGAIVQGWSWGGTGYSSPNVLGYVFGGQFSDETWVQTSDVMSFSTPQTSVSFLAFGLPGLSSPRSLIIEAFDSTGTSIRTLNVGVTSIGQRIEIIGPDITRVSYAASFPYGGFAIDDIILVPEPAAPALLTLFSAIALTASRFRRKK